MRKLFCLETKRYNANFSVNSKTMISYNPVHNQKTNEKALKGRKFIKELYEHTRYVNVKNMEEPSAEHF